jgi:hypothetical protein
MKNTGADCLGYLDGTPDRWKLKVAADGYHEEE